MTLNDFECPMTATFRQHDTGTVFSIDPKVAPFLKRNGIDVVTLASNHITDKGVGALKETIAFLRKAGVRLRGRHESRGRDEAGRHGRARRAVRLRRVQRGPGSAAGPTAAGVAWLTEENVRASVAAARKVADVVVVVPQWGWPEYHADFTARQKTQMKLFFDAGADQVIGHGTHWAGGVDHP